MPPQAQPNLLVNIVPIAAIFVIFYFFLIRPQQKQMKDHQNMLESLKKGDKILTSGGLYGTIVGLKGADLEVSFSQTVKLTVARSAVTKVITSEVGEAAPAKTPTAVS